jgi:hypothetical protein
MDVTVLALVLAALLGADPAPGPPASASLLPRSSIAAVLARRTELGLTDAEIEQLEEREAALQKQVAALREQQAARAARVRPGGGGRESRPGGPDAGALPISPSAAALPEGATGAGGHPGGGAGGHRSQGERAGKAPPASTATTATLQVQIDDADTAAWLGAEPLLREPMRERARAIAEAYREALADEQERAKGGR